MLTEETQRIFMTIAKWESINESMPAKIKLDAMGVDTRIDTLPSWAKWEQGKANEPDSDMVMIDLAEEFVRQIVFEAMWRTAQGIVRTAMGRNGATEQDLRR